MITTSAKSERGRASWYIMDDMVPALLAMVVVFFGSFLYPPKVEELGFRFVCPRTSPSKGIPTSSCFQVTSEIVCRISFRFAAFLFD